MHNWVNVKTLLLLLLVINGSKVLGQCTSAINTFPYKEDFEFSDGNWTTGGNASDWAWGIPSKKVITRAASGNKCWVAGGLTSSSYNGGENAYIQSPCFDISSISNPYISFNLFWETEKKFDGATFMYSIDGGSSWQLLGSYADYANCPDDNWFNTPSVTYPAGGNGWSGNIQSPSGRCGVGGGSGKWVKAKHTLIGLAGQKQVIFRFVFGAGTQCNDFDGFGVDDIIIGDMPANPAAFQYECAPNRTINFKGSDAFCPATYSWDFGDFTSGANNNSSAQNPSHIYSSTGKYTITLNINNPPAAPQQVQKVVQVADANIVIVDSIHCFGSNAGKLKVVVNGLPDIYTYQWNTNPITSTPIIDQLGAGVYSVDIKGLFSCVAASPITLPQPSKLTHSQPSVVNPICNTTGSIAFSVTGGTPNYNYQWTPAVSNADSAINLQPDNYQVIVQDAYRCTDTIKVALISQPNPIVLNLGADTVICPGEQLVLSATGNFTHYQWHDFSVQRAFTVKNTGNYYLTVADKDGCTASDTINVLVQCDDIYFPTAFTPNGDRINETFGPLPQTALAEISNYELKVFNRAGQNVFSSNNPSIPWDGRFGGSTESGIYVWYANFTIAHRKKVSQKGTLFLMK